MLGTRDRTLLLSSLRPPPGYRLRRAVGTSFTLDLMALLTAPLAFTFFDAHDEKGAPVTDPVALLEALRRHADKITLFCQAGSIGVPPRDQKLLAFIEDSVVEVQPEQNGGIFHPKVWVLTFDADDKPALYRVLCLSRNLTFARAWDTCLRLDGRVTDVEGNYARNEPLSELLLSLPKLSVRPIRPELNQDIGLMARELGSVDFSPPRPFYDFRVHNFGLGAERGWPFPTGGRSLVVSPFLVGSTISALLQEYGLEVLVSRPEAFWDVLCTVLRDEVGDQEFADLQARPEDLKQALDQVRTEALPKVCYFLFSGASLDSREGAEDTADAEIDDGEADLKGLHAKLFLFENEKKARLFVGSANATRAAFKANVEVLIELIGETKDCGINTLLDTDSTSDSLRSLLQEYRIPEAIHDTDEARPVREEVEWMVNSVARSLGAGLWAATVTDVDAQQRWDMTLEGQLPRIPAEVKVRVWPATLSSEVSLRINDVQLNSPQQGSQTEAITTVATFKGLSFEALTGFFAFEVASRQKGHQVRKRFAVTAELVGIPADRKERILRMLLSDRHRVLQLLFLILSGEGADVSAFVKAARREGPHPRGSVGGWNQSALLEALLRSLSRNPRQLDDAARLIEDLRKTAEGKELLPEGLDQIWEPVWAARQALKS